MNGKLRLIVWATALVMAHSNLGAQVHVKGYFRKDGTYVQPHVRSAPNGTTDDNWSTAGNVNPYTGKRGTKNPPPRTFPITPQVTPEQPLPPVVQRWLKEPRNFSPQVSATEENILPQSDTTSQPVEEACYAIGDCSQTRNGAEAGEAQGQSEWSRWITENAPNGIDVTFDGTVWLNLAKPGLRDDWAVRAGDLRSARKRGNLWPKFWLRGYHVKNADVSFRETKGLYQLDCSGERIKALLIARYDATGQLTSQQGEQEFEAVIPGTYAAKLQRLFCR